MNIPAANLRWLIFLVALAAIPAFGQQVPAITALTAEWPEIVKVDGIEILHVRKDMYMLVGGGANVTVQIGDAGVMLVDAGSTGQAEKIVAAIRHLTRKPLRFLVNTSADADKIGGNAGIVHAAGGPNGLVGAAAGNPPNAGILTIAQGNAVDRMMAGGSGLPPLTGDALPLSSFFTAKKNFYANGEPVEVRFQPHAHTDGDVFVFFRGSDVVSAGDIFRTDSYPVIDAAEGGTIQGEIDALNALVDIAIPERNQMGGTRVVPGHGRICNQTDVVEYRDMVTIIRDRIRDMVRKDMTLEQVKAAHPTLEYDGLYAADDRTRDLFIETIYNELSGRKQK
jgi:cyclase